MKILTSITLLFSASPAFSQSDSLPPRVYEFAKLATVKEPTRERKQILQGSTTSLSHFEVHASTVPACQYSPATPTESEHPFTRCYKHVAPTELIHDLW